METCPRGKKMAAQTQKITIRLPTQLIESVDMFINMGEFASRSEAIRRALKEYLENMAENYSEKAESWKKLQELQSFARQVEDIKK